MIFWNLKNVSFLEITLICDENWIRTVLYIFSESLETSATCWWNYILPNNRAKYDTILLYQQVALVSKDSEIIYKTVLIQCSSQINVISEKDTFF